MVTCSLVRVVKYPLYVMSFDCVHIFDVYVYHCTMLIQYMEQFVVLQY